MSVIVENQRITQTATIAGTFSSGITSGTTTFPNKALCWTYSATQVGSDYTFKSFRDNTYAEAVKELEMVIPSATSTTTDLNTWYHLDTLSQNSLYYSISGTSGVTITLTIKG